MIERNELMPNLYFGPESCVHRPQFRNPAFSVFELRGETLNIELKLNNDGEEADRVTINLYALNYSQRSRHLDHCRMARKDVDQQAILAMSSQPIRAWCDHLVPAQSIPAWRSDIVIQSLPQGTIGYLLVATVGITGDSGRAKPILPSEDPQVAIWVSESLGCRD